MLARIEFDSTIIPLEDLAKLEYIVGESVDTAKVHIKEDGSKAMMYNWEDTDGKTISDTHIAIPGGGKTYVVDLTELATAFRNIPYKVKSIIKAEAPVDAINRMYEKLTSALERFDKQVEFNETCNVHVPNLGLININELMLAEDICTDQLQGHLDQGYRIVAVSPQPDQRRPDYILGRYNPDFIGGDRGAKRS